METLQSTQSTPAHAFDPADADYLTKRGVNLALAWSEGFRSADEAEVHRLTGNVTVTGGGLVQAYRALPPPWDKSFKGYYRVQLRERGPDGKGKAIVPSGPVLPYLTSACTTSTTTPILICESPVKALSIMSAGYPEIVGLGGVSAGFFVQGSGSKTVQPHLEPFFAVGRAVYIVLDSNRGTNPAVAMAEARIARALLDRGCKVRIIEVPRTDDGRDQGPDDYIASKGKVKFDEIVTRARPAEPAEYAAAVATQPGKARSLVTELPFCASLKVGGPGELKATQKALVLYFTLADLKDAYKNHPAHRAAAVKQAAASASAAGGTTLGPWVKDLLRDDDGDVMSCSANLAAILENDPRWTGAFAFDLLANDIVYQRRHALPEFLPRTVGDKWRDEDDVSLVNWLQREWSIHFSVQNIRGVVLLVAHRREYCPVKRRLSALKWDGVPRVETWLSRYLGVATSEYASLVGKLWLVSAVARVFEPGCKADHMLVIEGEQGIGKSTALRELAFAGEFFLDGLMTIGDKAAGEQLRSKWLVEIAELAALRRRDVETVKAFVSRQTDNYRPAYGRSALDFPRRCIFAATVNPVADRGYLHDPTGARRFWPVLATSVDLDALRRDREQLWAEAMALYQAGCAWYPTVEQSRRLFAAEQEKRREVDAWEAPVARFVRSAVPTFVRTETLLTAALNIDVARHDALAVQRIAAVMHALAWRSKNTRDNGQQFKAWHRTDRAAPFAKDEPDVKDCGPAFLRLIQ